ncbi:MAG: DnaD domain protein [Eubacteriales bacterium]|nr:DnaD domain protein [Eubacteriales bacterium]
MLKKDDSLRIFGVTSVENLFFSQYMSDADGDFVKVYLSCLYHCQLGDESFGPTEIANELQLERAKVEAALRYWERRRLLTRKSDDPPTYIMHSLSANMLTGRDSFKANDDYLHFTESVYALFGDRRKIRPSEIASAYEWVQDLGLPEPVVLMLLSYCISLRGINFSFNYAGKVAVKIKEENISTPDEAERYFSKSESVRKGAQKVLSRFGLRRRPTDDEITLYESWLYELNYSEEEILEACKETVKATNPSFAYLNGILTGLKKRSGGENLSKQLQEDKDLFEKTKEILNILGVRAAPSAVQNAYRAMLKQNPHDIYVLAATEAARSGLMFEDLLPIVATWQKQSLDDKDKIIKYLEVQGNILPLVKQVLAESGQKVTPTQSDILQVLRWKEHFSEALILYAASLSRSAKQKMPYIAKVLDNFKQKGIDSVDKAQSYGIQQGNTKKVSAQQYEQRSYTEDELSSNAQELLKEAEKNIGS